ncbi:Transcriptional regulatory protein moc3 [Fusarium oxysporum f. sp. cubense race 1]|uniref:Transcriptional regulatory protein moc3 n=1 Tax=Fusarium oxysporum f. sp. cubense (strain race 1) TaxID=1229664 RepID=N4USL2_FUSC1|nr:Transcriptional regulatory protein moc3 [Fusarium oxysporum f. sp. cubense race 1]
MVYCGKASQGCQNCRVRRIKCDKIKPECSQCIRVGKKCPGYRDQLSLMFRDESSKVIQKAHAQWGVGESSEGLSTQTSSSSLASSYSSNSSTQASSVSASSSITSLHSYPGLSPPIDPSLEEQGVQFYVNRYLIGHPDEPRSPGDLSHTEWLWDPAVQDVMAAVGLASLSNLKDDPSMMTIARQRYGLALRQTGRLVQTSSMPDFEVTMRSVVMLAMFELVKGAYQGLGHVHAHVMGGLALLRRWLPMPAAAFLGVRAMVQMSYSLFIPAHMSATPLPDPLFEWISFARTLLDPADHPATDLGPLIGRFIQVSTYIKTHALVDGRSITVSTLKQLLDIDESFLSWERNLGPTWRFREEKAEHLPPAAVFDGTCHVYFDMFVARMYGHYRWARTLLNQTIIEFIKAYPKSSAPLISLAEYGHRYEIVRKLARDTLVSTPTHWRHPLLTEKAAIPVERPGGAGSGSAGLPVVLFHLQVAACAPGVPEAYWDWVVAVMECIWSDMGILHAKCMMDTMKAYRDSLKIKKEVIESSVR